MSLPVLIGEADWEGSTNAHRAAMPAGIEAGDLIVVVWMRGGGNTGHAAALEAGWVNLQGDGGNNMAVRAVYRIADGTETGDVQFSAFGSGSDRQQSHTWVFRGVNGTPEAAAWVNATGTNNADPPNLAPSWGAADVYWLAAGVFNATGRTVSAYPGGYTGTDLGESSGGLTPSAAIAKKAATGSSDNPGVFTWSGATAASWATTIAVQGSTVPVRAFGVVI